MSTQVVTSSAPGNHKVTSHCEHINWMLARITDKWTLLVIRVLGSGPSRFNALRREIGDISKKALANTLSNLEESGFVSRKVMTARPPQVEYALTELGRDFLNPVAALSDWVVSNLSKIEEARQKYSASINSNV